jgi:hypothetical protein
MCGESDHDRILVDDPLRRITDTLTKFLSCRERAGFSGRWERPAVFASSRRFGLLGAAKSRPDPGLERGLVRVRVRVTLDDGGHRYSQREQLMSDHSHAQLTVPNNLHDERIGATASANSDGRHETDERIRSEDPLLATDRLSQHTQLQPVAQTRNGGMSC